MADSGSTPVDSGSHDGDPKSLNKSRKDAKGTASTGQHKDSFFWMPQQNSTLLTQPYAVGDMRSTPPLRGESLWRGIDRAFLALKRLLHRAVAEEYNPFTQLGAVANLSFLIAVVTGVLLLFWYSPSISGAYPSLEAMKAGILGQLMRSLHRYSSDVCMLFALFHGLQVLGSRRIGGARWTAWITGILLIGSMWFVGWTGYWLVWDDRAGMIARESAKMLDILPIFSEPLMTTFVTDQNLKSLLFFLVFFLHMLLPLGFGVLLWLHIARLSRSHFLTSLRMSVAITFSMVFFSLLFPAYSSAPAKMLDVPSQFPLDVYYMAPLWLMERLSEGALWGAWFLAGVVMMSMPWFLVKRLAKPSHVIESRCNACMTCYNDCPFGAISMVPRGGEDPKYPLVARVDMSKCVGCGVCVGSCDSSGIGFETLDPLGMRKSLDRWLETNTSFDAKPQTAETKANKDKASQSGAPSKPSKKKKSKKGSSAPSKPQKGEDIDIPDYIQTSTVGGYHVAFVCAQSAATSFDIDMRTGLSSQLPGYLVVPVPCTGWVHMLLVERMIRHGAKGVLLVSCGPDPICREGEQWTRERLNDERPGGLRKDKIGDAPVQWVQFDQSDVKGFSEFAKSFREAPDKATQAHPTQTSHNWGAMGLRLAIALVLLGVLTFWGSVFPYSTRTRTQASLYVSVKHLTQLTSHQAKAKDTKNLLPHMRGIQTRRPRADLRLRITLDGKQIFQRSYAPQGVHRDGNAIAIEKILVTPGPHDLEVAIGETEHPKEWKHRSHRRIQFSPYKRRAVLFTRFGGFQWH